MQSITAIFILQKFGDYDFVGENQVILLILWPINLSYGAFHSQSASCGRCLWIEVLLINEDISHLPLHL